MTNWLNALAGPASGPREGELEIPGARIERGPQPGPWSLPSEPVSPSVEIRSQADGYSESPVEGGGGNSLEKMAPVHRVTIRVCPELCCPPHRVTHPEHATALEQQFRVGGWGREYPALVGYLDGAQIQLLSGSHRWAAAARAGIFVPVVVHTAAAVRQGWGDLGRWRDLMRSGDHV